MVLKKLQEMMNLLSLSADRHADKRDARRFVAGGSRAMKDGESAKKFLSGVGEIAAFHEEETSSWVTIDEFRAGKRGGFDACDLRHWLEFARLAGVPFVPAREILHLTEDEMGLASGVADIPEGRAVKRMVAGLKSLAEDILAKEQLDEKDEMAMKGAAIALRGEVDPEALDRKLFEAMDNVPEGWMVRSARCGPSNLKALAGSGLAGSEAPDVKFGPSMEVGPGWVRMGNRRRVHVSDRRTVESAAQGPVGGSSFLARPWVQASRYLVCDDPHRHGTQFAGKGAWPAEWRAFVEDGCVTGVSFYYSWAGEVSAENAAIAMSVWELAQKVVDQAKGLQMYPRYMDVEFMRVSAASERPEVKTMLEHFGREKVACTLDFIETREGLMLLEGGPANTPVGGGHPCGFAGCGGLPKQMTKTVTEGVAFKNMPHVLIGDPSTWNDGDRTGCILTREQVEELLLSYDGPGI